MIYLTNMSSLRCEEHINGSSSTESAANTASTTATVTVTARAPPDAARKALAVLLQNETLMNEEFANSTLEYGQALRQLQYEISRQHDELRLQAAVITEQQPSS